MKFHHIGIATDNIENCLFKIKKYFEIQEISDIVYDTIQDANLCMITLKNNVKIELVSGNIVKTILKKRQYLYHTCYEVNDIEVVINKLIQEDGALLVSSPKDAILFNNRKVAFLMWDLGLIELLEEEN